MNQDEIRPETWQLTVTRNLVLTKCHVEFKHLSITSADTLRAALQKPPEISTSQSPEIKSLAFQSFLDLSRNFCIALDLDEAIADITAKLPDLLDSESADLFRAVSSERTNTWSPF